MTHSMEGKPEEFKLTVELIPTTSWSDSLRNKAKLSEWKKIRKKYLSDYGNKCSICGMEGKLNLHEIWEFNESNHIQKLIGFTVLCNMCHFVKHIGNAWRLSKEDKLDYEKVIEHFMKVNICSREAFLEHRGEAYSKWKERSTYMWQIDFGEYKNILDEKKLGAKRKTIVMFRRK